MRYCITHGRSHRGDETDSVETLGDNLRCREEEWPNVVVGTATGSQCEPIEDDSTLVATGSLAYLVTETAGFVPVKVKKITDPLTGMEETVWEPPIAKVAVTAARTGFDRGEVLTLGLPTRTLIGRDQVYRKGGRFRINGGTRFLTDEGRTW